MQLFFGVKHCCGVQSAATVVRLLNAAIVYEWVCVFVRSFAQVPEACRWADLAIDDTLAVRGIFES